MAGQPGRFQGATEHMAIHGKTMQEIAAEVRAAAARINNRMESLHGVSWKGAAADMALGAMRTQQQQANLLVAILDRYGDAMQRGSNLLAGEENSAARALGAAGNGTGGTGATSSVPVATGSGLVATLNSTPQG